MLGTAAVNATPGPVAAEFSQSRAAAAAAHRYDSIKTGDGTTGDAKTDKTQAGAVINPTFRYDAQAQRMVMLMRDEKSGTVIVQVPSEVALRQYEQAVKRAQEDVAATQNVQAGQIAPVPQTTSIEAAALGVLVPFGSAALGEGSTGKAANPIGTKAPAAGAAGSITAGSGAHFTIVV